MDLKVVVALALPFILLIVAFFVFSNASFAAPLPPIYGLAGKEITEIHYVCVDEMVVLKEIPPGKTYYLIQTGIDLTSNLAQSFGQIEWVDNNGRNHVLLRASTAGDVPAANFYESHETVIYPIPLPITGHSIKLFCTTGDMGQATGWIIGWEE